MIPKRMKTKRQKTLYRTFYAHTALHYCVNDRVTPSAVVLQRGRAGKIVEVGVNGDRLDPL